MQGFVIYSNSSDHEIIDQDFYEFYRVSVRTRNLETIGKINQINRVINRYLEDNKSLAEKLKDYSSFLQEKFSKLFKEQ